MNRLIDADTLKKAMYHEAFETDSDMQKWDSGCWIRYKMFEEQIEKQPTIDAVPVVRCKDCKNWANNKDETFPHICKAWSRFGTIETTAEQYCSYGERVTE